MDGIYRRPKMMQIFAHNSLLMSEKGYLIFEKKGSDKICAYPVWLLRLVSNQHSLFTTPSHFQRLGTESARRVKGQGRSTAKKQTTLLRLYSLELSIRRSLTLPDAVKWGIHCGQERASVLRSFTLAVRQAKRVK